MAHEQPQAEQPRSPKLYGVVAEFATPDALMEAARRVREAGYVKFECYSPHPVHGIDQAMGTPYSPIPWFVLGGGLTGLAAAILMQWWMNAVDYKLIISGKPFWSLPANMPVAFELTVLLAGITAFVAMIGLNKLFGYYSPLNSSKIMQRVTNDKYALVIEADDPNFRLQASSDLLGAAGAVHFEACYEEHQNENPPTIFWRIITLLIAFGLIPMAMVFKASFVPSDAEPLRIDHGMAYQQKFKAQAPNTFFADGETGRKPIDGTVKFAGNEEEAYAPAWKFVTVEGKPPEKEFARGFHEKVKGKISEAMMLRGKERFGIYCAQCHGLAGYGDGMVHRVATERAQSPDVNELSLWVPPTSLHDPRILDMPEGQIYDTITNGARKMMGYAARITPEDRWAIVLYVRALQKDQFGKAPLPTAPPTPAPATGAPAGTPTKN